MVDTGIDKETQQKIIALISALIPEVRIYLFGSRVRGTHAKWSDIDIALDAGKKLPHPRVDEINTVFAATNMPYTVQVLDIHNVTDSMRESVLKEGVIWKE